MLINVLSTKSKGVVITLAVETVGFLAHRAIKKTCKTLNFTQSREKRLDVKNSLN